MNNLALYHVGSVGCNAIAFYTTRRLIAGIDTINAEDVVLLNGEKPIDGITPMVCGSCGLTLFSDDLEYRDAT